MRQSSRLPRQRVQKYNDFRHDLGLWFSDLCILQEKEMGRLHGQGSVPLFLTYTLYIRAI